MPIRLSCHLTEPDKIAWGVASLNIAIIGYLTGHHTMAGIAATYAAGFLLKPAKSIAKKLTQRPLGRLASVLALEAVGWGAEYIGIKTGNALGGTAINAASTIYLAHFLPNKDEMKAVIAEPKIQAALQALPDFLKRIQPSGRDKNLAVE